MGQAKEQSERAARSFDGLLFQGWVSIGVWMTFGLLLEGFLGYKIPAYLEDGQRRELFRLAHAHGTLLGLILVAAGLSVRTIKTSRPAAGVGAMRLGAVLMPLGFLLGGVWHPEGDPGLAIWMVPAGALMVIFGALAMALASRNKPSAAE